MLLLACFDQNTCSKNSVMASLKVKISTGSFQIQVIVIGKGYVVVMLHSRKVLHLSEVRVDQFASTSHVGTLTSSGVPLHFSQSEV